VLVFACVVTSRDSGNAVYGLIMPKNQLCMTGFTQCAPKVNCNRIHAVNQRIYVIFGNSLRGIAIIPENSIQSGIKLLMRIILCAGETWACVEGYKTAK
jgi:hypothetical protein